MAAGRADLVALGRPHLVDPSFTIKAAAWYGADVACPPQYLPGKEQIFRNSVRDREDFEDLKIKAKPKTRVELKAEELTCRAKGDERCTFAMAHPRHLDRLKRAYQEKVGQR